MRAWKSLLLCLIVALPAGAFAASPRTPASPGKQVARQIRGLLRKEGVIAKVLVEPSLLVRGGVDVIVNLRDPRAYGPTSELLRRTALVVKTADGRARTHRDAGVGVFPLVGGDWR